MLTKRHLERRETFAHWTALQDATGELVGLVSDMSAEGIGIHSDHGFKKGQQLSLRVSVDTGLSGSDHLLMQVENVWCQRVGVSSIYHAGFRIIGISNEAKLCLGRLLMGFSYPAGSPYTLSRACR